MERRTREAAGQDHGDQQEGGAGQEKHRGTDGQECGAW